MQQRNACSIKDSKSGWNFWEEAIEKKKWFAGRGKKIMADNDKKKRKGLTEIDIKPRMREPKSY